MPNQFVNDGGVVAGSRQLTIGGYLYDTDDFKFDTDSSKVVRTNGQNVPNGRKVVVGETSGTATLQFSALSTPAPAWGATFVTTEGTYYITKLGRAETKAGETKMPISFDKALTGSVVVS